jgi:hypothetical protein
MRIEGQNKERRGGEEERTEKTDGEEILSLLIKEVLKIYHFTSKGLT